MTTTLRITEVAERSGFSAPTLRYYETIGLLPPAERSDNGYRVYGTETLDRLAFIARAKQLGCSLDEITELNIAWDGGRCAPLQERLAHTVAAKVRDAQTRIAELTALVADLQRSAAVLASHTPDGPCDDRCGCTTDPALVPASPGAETDTATAVPLIAKPAALVPDPAAEPPIACTLGAGDVGQRLADWRDLLTHVVARTPVSGGIHLAFDPSTPVERIAALAAAEWDCCRFFALNITIDQRGVGLEVRAPDEAQDVLTSLFGEAV